jgi:pimeloyl-ACP methyl ester carboxylesterase
MIPSSFFITPKAPSATPEHALHGLIWQGPADAALPPVLCVHGLTRNAWDFAKLASTLSETRTVIALDMAGRNHSVRLAPQYYNYTTYVSDCIAVIDQLKLGKVDWVGTSMGGIIGMMIAAQRRDLIGKLVLNDVGPFIPMSALQRIALYVGKEQDFATMYEAERYCRATYADFGIPSQQDWWRFVLTSVKRKDDGRMTLNYDARIADIFSHVKQDVDLWAIYDAISAPTFILRGSRSDLLRESDAAAMTVRGPRAQLVTVDGVGHAPSLMDTSQIQIIRNFLAA